MKRLGIFVLLSSVLVLAWCGQTTDTPTQASSPAIEALASCLTNNGATFYGTERCPHCKDQKKLFGEAISKVNFVDCDKNAPSCNAAGVKWYPTWKFADWSELVGTQTLEALADKAGCQFGPEALVPSGDQNAQVMTQ